MKVYPMDDQPSGTTQLDSPEDHRIYQEAVALAEKEYRPTTSERIAAACAIAPRLSAYADEYQHLATMLSWYRAQEHQSWQHPTLIKLWRESIVKQEKLIADLQARYSDVLAWIDGLRTDR